MHGAVGEQGEDGGANVTAACPWASSAATGAGAEATTASELLAVAATGMAWVSVV
ncbi:MAG TPA: hypothetical protein VH268_10980 [Solirubrobacterales bacterium]|nr:hypothetical protein [Solirubrobacterales bacterium]